MSRRKEILKDAGIYTLSSYVAQVFDILNGILIRNFLGPANMGIWAFLQVIQNYAKHAGLGVTMATARDVPYFLEKGDKKKADEVQNLVFSFSVSTAVLVALGICIFAYWKRRQYSEPIFVGLLVLASIIVLQRLYNLFVVVLRSYKEFAFAGCLNIASSVMGVCLTILLAWKFKLYGFFAGVILNYIFMLGIILFAKPYRFSFHLDFKGISPLLDLGFAVLLWEILHTVLVSIDRIMIAKYLGFESLGHYSIALMAANYLYSLPNMVSIIFFPHFQEVFAQRDRHEDLEKFLREPTLCVAYLFPFLLGFVWTISSWIVPIVLPQYTPGIPALKYLILGSYFWALTHPFTNFIITVKRHWQLIPIQLFSVLLGFGMTGLFIRFAWGIRGVALAGILMALNQFLILSRASLKEVRTRSAAFLYIKVFGTFFVFTGTLFVVDSVFHFPHNGFIRFLTRYTAFFIVMSPFLWFAEREAKVVSSFRSLFGGLSIQKQKTYR